MKRHQGTKELGSLSQQLRPEYGACVLRWKMGRGNQFMKGHVCHTLVDHESH